MLDLIDRPYPNAHFVLHVDGLAEAGFSECTGLIAEVTTEEYLEGGENRFAHKFPTRHSLSPLVLKRGMTVNPALWTWFAQLGDTGRVFPRNGQILLLASVGTAPIAPVKGWAFKRGYPTKISGPDLNAGSPAVAVETIEITHHGLELVPLRVGSRP